MSDKILKNSTLYFEWLHIDRVRQSIFAVLPPSSQLQDQYKQFLFYHPPSTFQWQEGIFPDIWDYYILESLPYSSLHMKFTFYGV